PNGSRSIHRSYGENVRNIRAMLPFSRRTLLLVSDAKDSGASKFYMEIWNAEEFEGHESD
ncbi:unnamed protein product, partial [Nesidiocoris tenuis]